MKAIKRLLKFILWLVVTVVVIALLLVLTLPMWIGPVAKTAANRTVPDITGTGFRLGEFGLNYYTGNVRLGDVWLANPEGYTPCDALRLGVFKVDLDVCSLLEDTVIIHEIAIRDVFVSYVSKDGVYNFDAIAANAQNALAGEGCETVEETPQPEEGKEGDEEPASGSSQKKVIIDKIEIAGVTVQWGPVPLPLPKITLKDIGRESGGVSWDVAWREISDKLLNQINSLGKGLVTLGETGLGVATNSISVVSDALLDSSSVIAGATTNTVSNLKDSFKDGIGSTTEVTSGMLQSTGEVTAGAIKSAGEVTTDTLKSAGEATTDVLKSTGDTLKSAGQELKSIGKDFKNMFKNNK